MAESGDGQQAAPKSLKDRIAMFNQPAAAASPPPPKPVKRVFKWKTSDETAAEADAASSNAAAGSLNVAAVPPPAPSPTPGAEAAAPPLTTEKTENGAALEPVSSRVSVKSTGSADSQGNKPGFSAEDARATSGSLKDRIALLSGLKVDQPGAPGRAPKPWRKKTAEPSEDATAGDAATETAESGNTTEQPDLKVDTEAAQEAAPGTDTPGEPVTEKALSLPRPASPTDDLANVVDTEVKSPIESAPSTAASAGQPPSATGGVALPSMPTRAKGPPRKGRGAAATSANPSATTSPVAEQAPPLPSIDQQAAPTVPDEPKEAAPAIADISSPADGPKDFLDASAPSDDAASKADEEKQAEPEAISAPPAIPPPPPVASSGAMQDSDEEQDAPDFNDDDGTTGVTRTLARQSIEDDAAPAEEPTQPPKSPPPVPVASRPLPPMPARIDTDMTSPSSGDDKPLSPTNRRSMTRPPVPAAFQQSASVASPTSPTYEGIEQRRQSSMASAGVPEEDAGDGEFANPAIDSADVVAPPPPVSKPFDTEIVTSPRSEKPGSEATPASPVHSLENSMVSPSAAAPPPLPAGRPPPAPAQSEPSDNETNIGAASAYRATSPLQQQEEEAGGEEEFEDPEAARRQALAKRMAAMGGMKIGMLPPMFGGGGLKRKPTQTGDTEGEQPKSPIAEQPMSPLSPSAENPIDPAPTPAVGQAEGSAHLPTSPTRPVPAPSGPSYRPPAGAFVLPGIGKAPAVPPPPPAEEIDEELEEEIAAGRVEPEPAEPEAGDETVTQQDQPDYDEERPVDEEAEEEEEAPAPPPLPAGRPTRMPPLPTGQSFIDLDTDTDAASKRTSMTSSMGTGVGDTSAFPHPPGASPHQRTISSTSRMSAYAQEPVMEEGQEADDEGDYDDSAPLPTPTRPARAPPAIDTDARTLASDTDTQVMQSPVRTASMRSNQSIPQTPMSPTGRQASFSQMSPTASPSSASRRSSTMIGSSGGAAPPAGVTHAYLAHLGNNAARTKSKELDGAIASALNDIAYSRRTDPGNFGYPVWRTYVSGEKGQAPDLQINGRIEAGCIFSAWDAKFDRGLGRSSLKVGSLEVPHVGIVCEDVKDIKKAKVKVVELAQGRQHIEIYKLDDIKLGTVEIRRLP